MAASLAWPAQVSRVIDGDTFELSDGQKVRLIGVDCPETRDPKQAKEEKKQETEIVYITKTGRKYHRAGCRSCLDKRDIVADMALPA